MVQCKGQYTRHSTKNPLAFLRVFLRICVFMGCIFCEHNKKLENFPCSCSCRNCFPLCSAAPPSWFRIGISLSFQGHRGRACSGRENGLKSAHIVPWWKHYAHIFHRYSTGKGPKWTRLFIYLSGWFFFKENPHLSAVNCTQGGFPNDKQNEANLKIY